MILALRRRSGELPPMIWNGSHTAISESGMPILWAVLRPRCWSGRNRSLGARANPHSNAPGALDDVQTKPPCSPQKALMAAVEFIYVTGTMPEIPAESGVSFVGAV